MMLIIGRETLSDAVASNSALPFVPAISEAKREYQDKTGQNATHLHLTEADIDAVLLDTDFMSRYIFVHQNSFLPCGLPPVILGLQIAILTA